MSKENTSVGDVLGKLQEYEMQKEADFVKETAKLETAYAKKHTQLHNSLEEFESKEKAQFELKLKDEKLIAKKSAKTEVAVTQKNYKQELTNAKKNVSDAKKVVLKNLV